MKPGISTCFGQHCPEGLGHLARMPNLPDFQSTPVWTAAQYFFEMLSKLEKYRRWDATTHDLKARDIPIFCRSETAGGQNVVVNDGHELGFSILTNTTNNGDSLLHCSVDDSSPNSAILLATHVWRSNTFYLLAM
eukprot:scpid17735/ scgid28966/ 